MPRPSISISRSGRTRKVHVSFGERYTFSGDRRNKTLYTYYKGNRGKGWQGKTIWTGQASTRAGFRKVAKHARHLVKQLNKDRDWQLPRLPNGRASKMSSFRALVHRPPDSLTRAFAADRVARAARISQKRGRIGLALLGAAAAYGAYRGVRKFYGNQYVTVAGAGRSRSRRQAARPRGRRR